MLIHHKQFLPAFGFLGHEDQMPMCLYTVLSINDEVLDCAAYVGIGPTHTTDALIETIRAGGSKISEAEARELFAINFAEMELRYRK